MYYIRFFVVAVELPQNPTFFIIFFSWEEDFRKIIISPIFFVVKCKVWTDNNNNELKFMSNNPAVPWAY